jgi:hypothetical protein
LVGRYNIIAELDRHVRIEKEKIMKQLVVFLTLVALLLAACGKSDSVPDLSQAMPGEEVTLSEQSLDFVPQSVVPYGTEPALSFTDLELTQQGDTIQGKVNFSRQGQDDFTLVVYLNMSDELLVGYLDAEQNLILHLPGGTVLFGVQGYQLSSETGSIEFSLTAKVFGGFNVTGGKGTAFVFSVPGTVNPRSTLPGDQTDPETYQANSNLLEMEFDF